MESKLTEKLYSHMHVFYQPDLSPHQIILSEDESKHCIRVLRMKKGDLIDLADGSGTHAKAVITDEHPKKCVLEIVERNTYTRVASSGRNYYLHLLVAPTKNFDRIEWLLEKATEAGLDEITFIETTNSERTKVNMERCEKIVVSAMKQSKQWYLPRINPLTRLSEALIPVTPGSGFIAWCPTEQTATLSAGLYQHQPTDVRILVGPEGDFTEDETKLALERGYQPISLGKSILRTETAALYACMTAKAIASLKA